MRRRDVAEYYQYCNCNIDFFPSIQTMTAAYEYYNVDLWEMMLAASSEAVESHPGDSSSSSYQHGPQNLRQMFEEFITRSIIRLLAYYYDGEMPPSAFASLLLHLLLVLYVLVSGEHHHPNYSGS